MRAVVFGSVLLFTNVVTPVRGEAQIPARGATVRVATDSSRVVGMIVVSTADSIRLALSRRSDTVSVAVAAIRELAVAEGTRRHTKQGFVYGALGGAVVGATVGYLSYSPCTDTGFLGCYLEPTSRGQATAVGAGIGAILGMGLGSLVGALVVTERWVIVPTLSVH